MRIGVCTELATRGTDVAVALDIGTIAYAYITYEVTKCTMSVLQNCKSTPDDSDGNREY